jgi:hypothetical protein
MNLDLNNPGRSALSIILGTPIAGFGFHAGWHFFDWLMRAI